MRENEHYLPKQCFLTLLLAATCGLLAAQSPRIESLTIADGLSQGMIYDILQTSDGFLWFATKDGLNRFDGYGFEVFTNDPFDPFSISGNEISSLFEDSRGNLWIDVATRGVDMLEKSTGRFFHLEAGANKLSMPNVLGFAETKDGVVWLGTSNGLHSIQSTNAAGTPLPDNPDLASSYIVQSFFPEKTQSPQGQPANYFQGLLAKPDGGLLVASLQNLFAIAPGSDEMTVLENRNLPLFHAHSKGTNGRVWAIDREKLYLLRPDSHREGKSQAIDLPAAIPFSRITQFETDGNGNLVFSLRWGDRSDFWLILEEALLQKGTAAPVKLVASNPGFSPSMGLDRSGNLWIGTSGYGLRKTSLAAPLFQHFLPGKSVRQVHGGEKIHLKVSPDDMITRLDEPSDSKRPPTDFSADYATNVLHSSTGTWWMLHNPGRLIRYPDSQAFSFGQQMHEYTPMLEDHLGGIWIGCSQSRLLHFDPVQKAFAKFDLSEQLGQDAAIYAIFEDVQHDLWVGSNKGMVRMRNGEYGIRNAPDSAFRIPNSAFFQTNPANPRSLRQNFVTSICDDPINPQQFLWIGTKGGGLNLLDKTTGEFRHFTSQNSDLPNDVIYGILPEEGERGERGEKVRGNGKLWMSTNRGLSRLTVDRSNPSAAVYRFRNFRASDGLQDDEFNTSAYDRCPDGRLLFGGINGLTAFYPSQIRDEKPDARMRIIGLKINNLPVNFRAIPLEGDKGVSSVLQRPVHQTEHLTLRYDQNLVTFEFALLDFSNPQENRYRYRLRGVDPDWVEAGTTHVANYTRLRPGSYVFEVQGNIGGVWNEEIATMKITVRPPWWATWWAYGMYALAAAAAAWWLHRFRERRRSLERQLEIEHLEANRLKEMDDFKSRFFTNITHEFRTPLTVILGTSEQLAGGSEQLAVGSWQSVGSTAEDEIRFQKSKFERQMGLIRRNGQNLLRLINQILDLAKLEDNSLKINYVQGDLLPYLRYISESLHSLANAQNVMLKVESPEAQIVMDYDPERLLQIVHNLLSNAIKFTPSGGRVTLVARPFRVGSAHDPEGAGYMTLTVSDTGVGISPENLPRIFDRFYQAENQQVVGGSGIGLSLTKELVKAMGGEISVESETGRGTAFTVRLPITQNAPATVGATLAVAPVQNAPVQQQGRLEQQQGRPQGSPLRTSENGGQPTILLIEDNLDVVEYLSACLGENYQLDFAYNGRAGIEKALETVPDLILSDVMMPEKDGFEVCDFLKNDERTSHIPIVLLTAKADVESRIAGLRRGADAYLAKPFHQEELLVTLENLLELRRKLQSKYVSAALSAEPAISPPAAEAAGTVDPENEFLKKLRTIVEENLSDASLDVDALCRKIGMGRTNLHNKLSALTGLSTSIFVRKLRLQRAKQLLGSTEMNVSEIAYEVGFNDPKFFSRVFSEEFGLPPSEVKKS